MSAKDINMKIHTRYFIDDIINIKDFDPNNIKIDEMSYKNILTYYITYVKIENSKCVKINSANHLYLLFKKKFESLEEIDGNKYLTLIPTNERKEKTKKYEELWIKIRDLIWLITIINLSGVVVRWLSLLHNLTQLHLSSGSAQVQTVIAACQRFAMVRISDNGPG